MEENEIEQEESELLGSVTKNETTTIQVRRVHFKGQSYLDIREFVDGENYQGPTKRGIRIHDSLLEELTGLLGTAAA